MILRRVLYNENTSYATALIEHVYFKDAVADQYHV